MTMNRVFISLSNDRFCTHQSYFEKKEMLNVFKLVIILYILVYYTKI